MYDSPYAKSRNQYIVNFLQFSGHGFMNSKNEAIFVLPDKNSCAYRIINVDRLS